VVDGDEVVAELLAKARKHVLGEIRSRVEAA
jgi:hypothetical protein